MVSTADGLSRGRGMEEMPEQVPEAGQGRIKVDIAADQAPEGWDGRVGLVPEGAYRQTTHYGIYQAHWRRETPLYLTARLQGRVVGQLLALQGGMGAWGLARRSFSSLTLPIARRLLPHVYWMEGPLVFDSIRRDEVAAALIRRLLEYVEEIGGGQVEGMPSFYGAGAAAADEGVGGDYNAPLTALGFSARRMHTLVVHPDADEDALWAKLKREARTKVRRAENDGIRVVPIADEEDLHLAYDVVGQTIARNGLAPMSWRDFLYSFEFHRDCGIGEAFLSLHGKTPLSYQRVAYYNGNAVLGGVAYADCCRSDKLYGNDLMQWNMIKWAQQKGLRRLDYGGADPHATDAKHKGIYRFKSKWGGNLTPYDYFTKVDTSGMRGQLFALATRLTGRRF